MQLIQTSPSCEGVTCYRDTKSNYQIAFNTVNENPGFQVEFWIPEGRQGMIVTSRTIKQYRAAGALPSKSLQLLEAGPGLGDLIPTYIRKFPKAPRPVAVDLANYELISEILHATQHFAPTPAISKRVQTIIENCSTIIDAKKVQLLTGDFETEIKKHPELLGTIDWLVDYAGPGFYGVASDILAPEVKELQRALCKPHVQLFPYKTTAYVFRKPKKQERTWE
jgi:hypothetical protein